MTGIGLNIITKLRRSELVNIETIMITCNVLNCNIENVVDIIQDIDQAN